MNVQDHNELTLMKQNIRNGAPNPLKQEVESEKSQGTEVEGIRGITVSGMMQETKR